MGVNLVGNQGWKKISKCIQKVKCYLFRNQICFLLELVSVMIFNFLSNFLDSLDISRDKGQESAFIP